jgi:hypothetical protein
MNTKHDKIIQAIKHKIRKGLDFVGGRPKIRFNRREAGDVVFEELPPFKIPE